MLPALGLTVLIPLWGTVINVSISQACYCAVYTAPFTCVDENPDIAQVEVSCPPHTPSSLPRILLLFSLRRNQHSQSRCLLNTMHNPVPHPQGTVQPSRQAHQSPVWGH